MDDVPSRGRRTASGSTHRKASDQQGGIRAMGHGITDSLLAQLNDRISAVSRRPVHSHWSAIKSFLHSIYKGAMATFKTRWSYQSQ